MTESELPEKTWKMLNRGAFRALWEEGWLERRENSFVHGNLGKATAAW